MTSTSTLAKPEKITQADIDAALDADAIIASAAGSADFKDLVELAGQELMRRFREDPTSLPGTFIIKLYLDGMKALAAGSVPEQGDLGSVDLLASFDALPPETALPLIKDEMTRLAALWHEYDAVRQTMEEGPA